MDLEGFARSQVGDGQRGCVVPGRAVGVAELLRVANVGDVRVERLGRLDHAVAVVPLNLRSSGQRVAVVLEIEAKPIRRAGCKTRKTVIVSAPMERSCKQAVSRTLGDISEPGRKE